MPAGTQVRFRPAVVSRSSPHLFTPPHFLSEILHCPIQIKAKNPINKSKKKTPSSLSQAIRSKSVSRPMSCINHYTHEKKSDRTEREMSEGRKKEVVCVYMWERVEREDCFRLAARYGAPKLCIPATLATYYSLANTTSLSALKYTYTTQFLS